MLRKGTLWQMKTAAYKMYLKKSSWIWHWHNNKEGLVYHQEQIVNKISPKPFGVKGCNLLSIAAVFGVSRLGSAEARSCGLMD